MSALNRFHVFPRILKISSMAILMTASLACLSSTAVREPTGQPLQPTVTVGVANTAPASTSSTYSLTVNDSSGDINFTFWGKDLENKDNVELVGHPKMM